MMNQGGRSSGAGGAPRVTGMGRRGPVGVLKVVSGNDRGKQFPLAQPQTQIGRGADQDFVLADISVSRRHVLVLMEGERYRLQDLGSGNGTMVNGVRTPSVLLNDGDQIEIGNTLLRFEQPQPVAQVPVAAPPPMTAAAGAHTLMAEAPQGYGASPSFPSTGAFSAPGFAQADGIPAPPPSVGGMPILRGAAPRRGGLFDTPLKRGIVFGTLGLLVLVLGGAVIVRATSGGHNREQASKLYIDGIKAFADGNYEGAKTLFSEVLRLAPDQAEAQQKLKQCEAELKAQGILHTAQGLASGKQWEGVLAALDKIDQNTVAYGEAQKLRGEAVTNEVTTLLKDARASLPDDTENAKYKVAAALKLDPTNGDAKLLQAQLQGGGAAPAVEKAPEKEEKPAERTPARERPAPRPAATPRREPAAGGGSDLQSNRAAYGAYRARDFAGAANILRRSGTSQANNLAAQIARLGDFYHRAQATSSSNPVGAVGDYQRAAALDAQVGGSIHANYFRDQASTVAKNAARQAFNQQRYDLAYDMAKVAQRSGDDGGIIRQLSAKATSLNIRARQIARSNPDGAKTIWRSVLRMVPPNDAAYQEAAQGLRSGGGGRSSAAADEDED